jgi:hypothetical protein
MTAEGSLFGRPYTGNFDGNNVNAELGIEPMLDNTQLVLTFDRPVENIEKLVERLANVYTTITESDSIIEEAKDEELPEEAEELSNTWHIYKSGIEKEVMGDGPLNIITVKVDGNKCKIDIFSDAYPRARDDEARQIVKLFRKSFDGYAKA